MLSMQAVKSATANSVCIVGSKNAPKNPLKNRAPRMRETQRRVPRFVFSAIHLSFTEGGAILRAGGEASALA